MASFKFQFKASKREGLYKGRVFIRVIHKRKVAYISTDYKIYPHEWDTLALNVLLPDKLHNRYNYLLTVADGMKRKTELFNSIVRRLEKEEEYTVQHVADAFKTKDGSESLKEFCERTKRRLEDEGHYRTARAYVSSVTSLYKFTKGKEIFLADIDAQLIMAYESYLLGQGLKLNTISFYMRNLRALYKRAIKEKIIKEKEEMPFRRVFTGVAESEKRTLSRSELNKLAEAESFLDAKISKLVTFPDNNRHTLRTVYLYLELKRALLYFLFCYHARGMSFVDLCYLKKTDINEDVLIYRRKKTGGLLSLNITPPMRKIIQFFSSETAHSDYLFPIIREVDKDERKQYENGLRKQNQYLTLLSQMIGLKRKVTTHVSRHTWATLAKRSKAPIALISEALGHKDIKTTDRYLASFEKSVLDHLSTRMSGLIAHKKRSFSCFL